LDALKRVEGEKILVSSYDVRCQAACSKGEKFVVLWITAGLYLSMDIDPLRFSREGCEEVTHVVFVHIPAKLLAMQDLG